MKHILGILASEAKRAWRIHGGYRDFKVVKGVARVVSLDDSPPMTTTATSRATLGRRPKQDVLTLEEAMRRLPESAHSAFKTEEKLVGMLKREGLLK